MLDGALSHEPNPEVALHRLAQRALAHWRGSFGTPALVKFRENAVFSVHDSGGARYALRLHRQDYHSPSSLQSELTWMRALSDHGLRVPTPVEAQSGGYSVAVTDEHGTGTRFADLLIWLNGQTLTMIEGSPDTDPGRLAKVYEDLGAEAAKLHVHGESWIPPADFVRLSWDVAGLVGEQPLWGRFWELDLLSPAERALAHQVRAVLAEDLGQLPVGPATYGLIHGDLLADNVILDNDRIQLIDFDDAGWGWHVFELATILYSHRDSPLFDLRRDALLRGYRRVRALPDEQEAQLPLFLLARGVTYLGWLQTRQETQTAREQSEALIRQFCNVAQDYLNTCK